jgi:hypothetical protein
MRDKDRECAGESVQSGTYRERDSNGEILRERERESERERHSMPRYLVMPWAGYKED